MPIIVENGIQIGGGILIGSGSVSFQVLSADLSNPQNYYGGYSSMSPSGFTSDGTYLYNGIRYNITTDLYNTFASAQIAAGFRASEAWVWSIAFNTGGTCLARVGLVPGSPNFIVIAPIDQTDTNWQAGDSNGPTLTGTFTFPATFTAYSPATNIYGRNSWC